MPYLELTADVGGIGSGETDQTDDCNQFLG